MVVPRPSSIDGGQEDLKIIFHNQSAVVTSRKAVKLMFKTNILLYLIGLIPVF